MQQLIINFFKGSGAVLEPLNTDKKENSIIYYFNYKNFNNINKLNLIIKSLKAFLNNNNIFYSFESGTLKIEIETQQKQTLYFNNYFQQIPKNQNYIFLGVNNNGEPMYESIYKIKSLLIGGSSGSGKSNLLHQIILSILLNNKNIYLLLIDLKGTELAQYQSIYNKTNRILKPVATQQKQAFKLIIQFYNTMLKRYKRIKRNGGRACTEPPIVLIIDEYAQLFINNKQKNFINNYIAKIGALGRACNCFLYLATQHPTNDNINNSIRANLQSRIALKCLNTQQSNNIINNSCAFNINRIGDAFIHIDGDSLKKINISYISDDLLQQFKQAN